MAACLQIAGLKRADYLFRVPLVGARTAGTAMCMLTHDGAVSSYCCPYRRRPVSCGVSCRWAVWWWPGASVGRRQTVGL